MSTVGLIRSNVFLQTIGNILYRYATIPDAIMTAIVYEKNNLISALKLFIASLPRPWVTWPQVLIAVITTVPHSGCHCNSFAKHITNCSCFMKYVKNTSHYTAALYNSEHQDHHFLPALLEVRSTTPSQMTHHPCHLTDFSNSSSSIVGLNVLLDSL